MESKIKADLDTIYTPAKDIVAKEIQKEFVLIPIKDNVVDMENKFFKLTETAKAMWDKMSPGKNLKEIARELSMEYEAPLELIERDLLLLVEDLLNRRMLIAVRRV